MELVLAGVSHRTATIDVRARLATDPAEIAPRLSSLVTEGLASEAACVSTCNRLEVYAVIDDGPDTTARATEVFLRLASHPLPGDASCFVITGVDAGRHAMRVAAGLDSLVLGERQILAQVKEAVAVARAAGTLGPVLDRVFNFAMHAAKRVQAETELTTGTVSVASAAIVLAEKVLGSMAGRRALVVGAGETGTLAARHLAKRKPAQLAVANRTVERVQPLVEELGVTVLPIVDIGRALAEVDVVVCATHAQDYLVTSDMVQRARAVRGGRPLVLVDISVPRNVDPAVAEADDVFLYTIDGLSAVVQSSLAKRKREASKGEVIVEQEAAKLAMWMRALATAPVVRQLHDHFERVRADEVERSLSNFPPETREHVERLTKSLVSKLLRAPTVRLRSSDAATGAAVAWSSAVRELFALDQSEDRQGANRGV